MKSIGYGWFSWVVLVHELEVLDFLMKLLAGLVLVSNWVPPVLAQEHEFLEFLKMGPVSGFFIPDSLVPFWNFLKMEFLVSSNWTACRRASLLSPVLARLLRQFCVYGKCRATRKILCGTTFVLFLASAFA